MKAFLVIPTILIILGICGLMLASNQTTIPDEEYLTYKVRGEMSPSLAKSQQQFTFVSGLLSLIFGALIFVVLVFVRVLNW